MIGFSGYGNLEMSTKKVACDRLLVVRRLVTTDPSLYEKFRCQWEIKVSIFKVKFDYIETD